MKIICDKDMHAYLVRACTENKIYNDCDGCIFHGICSQASDTLDNGDIMTVIEDICELEVVT